MLGGLIFLFVFFVIYFRWNFFYKSSDEYKNFAILKEIYSWDFHKWIFLKQSPEFKRLAEANSNIFEILHSLTRSGYIDRLSFESWKNLYYKWVNSLQIYSWLAWYFSGKDRYLYNIVLFNYIKSKELLDILWLYTCSLRYKQIFKNFDILENKINEIKNLLNKNINLLKKILPRVEDKYLKNCLTNLLTTFQKSLINLTLIEQQIKSYLFNFKKSFYWYIRDYQKCINDDDFFDWIKDGIHLMNSWLNSYIDQYWKIYKILKFGNEYYWKKLCKGAWKLSSKFNENNKKLTEGFKKLTDRLRKKRFSYKNKSEKNKKNSKKNDQNQDDKEQWKEKNNDRSKEKNKKDKVWWEKKHHYHINDYEVKKLMNQIWKKSEIRIDRMQSIKSSSKYNPEHILKQWFKEFYWNDSEFKIFKDLNWE